MNNYAGIIAAGWGERLGQKIPKALTPVGEKKLIDYVLDGLEASGITHVTCIVNDAAKAVPEYVAQSHRTLTMDWIIQTTPSSMHSFLLVLERLAQSGPGPFLMTTVDGVALPETYRQFADSFKLFPDADVLLGLTDVIDDEKPLRVAMKGAEETGLMPEKIQDNPHAFEIVALTSTGFDSEYVTSGFYGVNAGLLDIKQAALEQRFSALRQFLGYALKYGRRFYGVPLPPVIDVDRPEDIKAAEKIIGA